MTYAAELDSNNIVIRVITGSVEWAESRLGGRWVTTNKYSDDQPYAAPGFTYDETLNAFIPPQPYLSWVLNDLYVWESPIPMPDDGQMYQWNENTVSWVPVDQEP